MYIVKGRDIAEGRFQVDSDSIEGIFEFNAILLVLVIKPSFELKRSSALVLRILDYLIN